MNKIEKFGKKHTAAKGPLEHWRAVTAVATWKNPAEVKTTFASVSIVAPQTIFNIGGNNYRLIALVVSAAQSVLVQVVLTHAEEVLTHAEEVLTHAEYDRR
jgi:mRNA interferase HigB